MIKAESTWEQINQSFLFWAIITTAAWGGVPVLAKLGSGHLNGFEMTFWINLFALPIVTLWVLPKDHRRNIASLSIRSLVVLSGIGFLGNLIYQILYFSSYQTISALTGSVFSRVGNVLFVAASMFFLKEKHSKANWAALLLATIGSILSTAKPGATFQIDFTAGFWMLVIATLLNTGYNFANNAAKKQYTDVGVNLFIFKVSTLLIISIWAILTGSGLLALTREWSINLSPPLGNLFVPFVIGALADGIGFFSFLKMLQISGSLSTTLVSAFIGVIQVLLSVLFYRETASFLNAVLAPALVIIPMIFVTIIDRKKKY